MEDNKTNFDELNIFNCIKLKSYLSEQFNNTTTNNKEIENNSNSNDFKDKLFICGKMNEHSIQAKYSFKACDFLIYMPFNKTIFHSEMNSLECFTSSLKWNQNFFKKLRLCLESSETVKNTYFAINYEKKKLNKDDEMNDIDNSDQNSRNNIISDLKINSEEDDNEFDTELTERKIYLELHFIVEKQDIIAFILLLNHTIDDKPYLTILNKFLEFDKIESDKLNKKQLKVNEKDKEINRMEKEINTEEENLEKRKKQYLYKFYYLNKEKNIKIIELSNQLKKEKKLFV